MCTRCSRFPALFSALLLTFVAVSAFAGGNVFRDTASTVGGYSTWHSDAIDIENVTETGRGVYVAVLDTGLAPNYRDYFPAARIAARLGKGFYQKVSFKAGKATCAEGRIVGPLIETGFVGSRGSEHGTHVTSTIIGFNYRSNFDAASGFGIPPIQVRGIAPDVTIIPVKVLADYQISALPDCGEEFIEPQHVVFGTTEMVAAGINYVTDLAIAGYRPMVINMSLGGATLEDIEKEALDRAIANGVIVVASAGNAGPAPDTMRFPGGYAPVISAAAAGWNREFVDPDFIFPYRMYWLRNGTDFSPPLLPFGGEISEPTPTTGLCFNDSIYVIDFSSREGPDTQLDVTAPGVFIRGPFAGDPGYSHLPWWSSGIADLLDRSANPGNFFYVSGTSMASPHVAGVAALMVQKNPGLVQAQVETILKATAIPIPPGFGGSLMTGFCSQVWGPDATGAGLVQADEAVNTVP